MCLGRTSLVVFHATAHSKPLGEDVGTKSTMYLCQGLGALRTALTTSQRYSFDSLVLHVRFEPGLILVMTVIPYDKYYGKYQYYHDYPAGNKLLGVDTNIKLPLCPLLLFLHL